jgi:hypothetical protein
VPGAAQAARAALQPGLLRERREQPRVGQSQRLAGRLRGQACLQGCGLACASTAAASCWARPATAAGGAATPLTPHCAGVLERDAPAPPGRPAGRRRGARPRRQVRHGAGGHEGLRPLGGGAPAAQHRRVDVEDEDACGDGLGTRVAQQRAVAGAQRERPVQGQPGGVLAERAQADGDAGRADVQDQLRRQRTRVRGQPDVDAGGRLPAPGVSSASPRPTSSRSTPAQVHRDAGDRAHLVVRRAEALQAAHPDGAAAQESSSPAAQRARRRGCP